MAPNRLRPPTSQRPRPRPWDRLGALVPVVVLGALVWRLGTGPFLEGLARVDARALAAACAVAVVTTWACAWRWTLVARSLGVAVPLRTAVGAYYRSQFLNVATPGGMLGDVDRGLRQGRDAGDRSGALRSVVWDRLVGQGVLLVVAGSALVLLPSPAQHVVRLLGATAVAVSGAAVLAVLVVRRTPWSRNARRPADLAQRMVRRAGADVRAVLLERHTRAGILLASVVALAGHVLTFVVAARTAGAGGTTVHVLPLALVVILAMGLPNLAGWGPREGAAAWAFGAGGLGAQQGVVTAVVYGVMVFVGALPGAALVLVAWSRQRRGVAHG